MSFWVKGGSVRGEWLNRADRIRASPCDSLPRMTAQEDIPLIDARSLAGGPGPARDTADATLARAARSSGFFVLMNVAADAHVDAIRRQSLFEIFGLPEEDKRALRRQRFEASNPNRYRGLAPMSPALGIGTEHIDFGPDAIEPEGRGDPEDVLCERSAWPRTNALPNFRTNLTRLYSGFEQLGRDVVAALERVLGLVPGRLGDAFVGGNSTLRLVRHPVPGEWDASLCERLDAGPGAEATSDGNAERRLHLVLPHTDSGCVTFVSQDAGGGLEVQGRSNDAEHGELPWLPVPTGEGWLAVNFGQLLERWTGGMVRATPHRVIGAARGRTSILFFYEPAVDARISPLAAAPAFEPFLYGDYVWARMQRFPDYQHLGGRWREREASTPVASCARAMTPSSSTTKTNRRSRGCEDGADSIGNSGASCPSDRRS
jgi:isopenicillin N synthase-like dioxygenase